MSKRLEELGAEVARIQDEALVDDRRRASVRRRLLSKPDPLPERTSRWAPALAWAGAMAAIALVIVLLWPRAPEPIAYRVDDGAVSTAIDRSIAASSNSPTSIAFTDGSSIRLAPSASARVRRLSTDGAIVALDRGEATVSVRHREGTRWSVAAGPFFVRVTGTRFRVGWQPQDGVFDLAVLEGEVRVSAPDTPAQILRDGNVLHRTLTPDLFPDPEPTHLEDPVLEPTAVSPRRSGQASTRRATPSSEPARSDSQPSPRRTPSSSRGTYRPPSPLKLKLPPKDPNQPDPEVPKLEEKPEEELGEQEPPEPQPESIPPDWKTMLEEGQYEALLTELAPSQVERALWQAGPHQLVDLGATARQLHDTRAGYIYSVVRSRFPGTEAAADAAFILGRMQFHSGAYQTAATWFETYVRERPDGRFGREAAGRLIESYNRSADERRAREAAEKYLGRYPNGPHADLARTVLE